MEIVVIDGENDTPNALKFIKKTGLPYQFFESGSKEGEIEQGLFGYPSYPTSYLIDKNGKLVYANVGYSDGDEEKHGKRIDRFLND